MRSGMKLRTICAERKSRKTKTSGSDDWNFEGIVKKLVRFIAQNMKAPTSLNSTRGGYPHRGALAAWNRVVNDYSNSTMGWNCDFPGSKFYAFSNPFGTPCKWESAHVDSPFFAMKKSQSCFHHASLAAADVQGVAAGFADTAGSGIQGPALAAPGKKLKGGWWY